MNEQQIRNAVLATREEILTWAKGPKNNSALQDEAFRTCVHIAGALQILADKITATGSPSAE